MEGPRGFTLKIAFRGRLPFFVSVLIPLIVSVLACNSSKPKTEPINTLRIPIPEKISGFDPALADDIYTADEASRAYEGLFQYHYLKRPYVLVPALAESLPAMSSDSLTYTFKIKSGILFQDDPCFKSTNGKGRELIADDVVYSLLRLADPRLHSNGWYAVDGKIVGLNEWREDAEKNGSANYTKVIEGIKSTGRYSVQIKLKERLPRFLYTLATPFASIVAKEAVEYYGKEFSNHPVGTGPFKLSEYLPASKITWVKNPTYRSDLYPSEGDLADKQNGLLSDSGKSLPFVEKIVVSIFEDSQAMWRSFLHGDLDLASIPKEAFSQTITPAKELTPELRSRGISLVKTPFLDVTHISFNMSDPLVGKNKYLRQAMSLAYDEAAFIDLFYNGRAIPAQGPIPPGVLGYDPDFKNQLRSFDLGKAKDLMAKAGFPEGKNPPPIEWISVADGTSPQSDDFAQRMFAALGIHLNISSYSWPEFQSAVKNKKGQIWSLAWSADYPEADDFLQLFYSKYASPGPNDSNYANPEYDQLYEKALLLENGPARNALYKRMVEILSEDCPWIFGVHRLNYLAVQSRLKNFKVHDFSHGMAKYYRIDSNARK